MSSAALQSAPHQTPATVALNTPHLAPDSPTSRHYQSSPSSSANREPCHASPQNTATASPSASASKRPSRKYSGTGGGSGGGNGNGAALSQSNSPMSSRAALASSVPANTSSEHQSSSSSDRRRNMPATTVPPRTSSTQHTQGSSGGGPSSRRPVGGYGAERTSSSHRHGGAGANGQVDAPQAQPDDVAAQSSRNRRSHHAGSEHTHKASNSQRDARGAGTSTSIPIRAHQQPSSSSSSKGPSREASEILNSMLVSQPEEDVDRERERIAMAQPHATGILEDEPAPPPIIATLEHGEEARRGGRSRHDHSKREKHTKFGEYILGNTIGEGEFGKVKLGWKQEGGIQVAIKLIKKDQLGSNPSRMAKIMREVSILKQLTHPNIVRLHKMEESERHYGIVLEYASGGELFDYILNHRYLKDNAARRLFAQLVSGVGYLHKKGIVHRDLKLENLLLDRNRNIIITDFGFANTFDPAEELTEEEELSLSDREFVKHRGLNQMRSNGMRKGDLMQTSCGSPCYAAPELVVSDSLYTGRKVDVWSCGVILYAMLAGYLPFDDDPANPEGDNINLLYKYIVNTPLTFPEYVTPHARDLLRRILVPNPRKRADLFEVARHSWLSEYAHVVEFITSATTTSGEIQNTTVPAEDGDGPNLGRSASVRESHKKAAASPALGGLASKQGTVDPDTEAASHSRQQRDNKRRTVQVEYVAPNTQTQRGESVTQNTPAKSRVRSGSQGPVEAAASTPKEKPLPRDPPVSRESYGKSASRRPPSAHRSQNVPPSRSSRDGIRAASDHNYNMTTVAGASVGRPTTGGSTNSLGFGGGRATIQQPASGAANYTQSDPVDFQGQKVDYGRPNANVQSKFAKVSGYSGEGESGDHKGHKRSNTIGDIGGKLFGRSGSLFGARNRKSQLPSGEKTKKYPPVSMTQPMSDEGPVRPSMESKRSRRSFSLGLGKKRSGSISGSQTSQEKQNNRRFSLLPNSFSLRAIGLGKEYGPGRPGSQQDLPMQEPPQLDEYGRYVDRSIDRTPPVETGDLDGMYTQLQPPPRQSPPAHIASQQQQYAPAHHDRRRSAIPQRMQQQGTVLNSASESSIDNVQQRSAQLAPYQNPNQADYSDQQLYDNSRLSSRGHRGVLQKNKRFVDAYDTDDNSRNHDHGGSSGAARKVMDFFRRRGKARGENR